MKVVLQDSRAAVGTPLTGPMRLRFFYQRCYQLFSVCTQRVTLLSLWSGQLSDTEHIIPSANLEGIWATMSILTQVNKGPSLLCVHFPEWQRKAGDTVTSNEKKTSHPIGCSVHLTSKSLWKKQSQITSVRNSATRKGNVCVGPPAQQHDKRLLLLLVCAECLHGLLKVAWHTLPLHENPLVVGGKKRGNVVQSKIWRVAEAPRVSPYMFH